MQLLLLQALNLPLGNPVLKFLIILLMILFIPLLSDRIRVPHLLGFIVAGILLGPYGFNVMDRDSGIEMLGAVGLLYIMFQAGLEMDIADFKKNGVRSVIFGLYTFLIPMGIGFLAGYYVLGFGLLTSILLASLFASHTLITYPIVSALGVTKNPAVTVAVGGTMITDTLALLVLTVIVGLSAGEVDGHFWIRLALSFIAVMGIILFVFPLIGRWFFKHVSDHVAQYIFVLTIVFLGAFMVEVAGIEPIIGAFMAGLAMNRLIPRTSGLMNRVEFMGSAFFIPFFLLGVGMLIDYRAFIKDFDALKVAFVMIVVATGAKFFAAYATQKTFGYSLDQRRLIYGLSNSQAAATLAAVLVGYEVILGYAPDGEPIRLLGDSVLNGSILMILVTCVISSFITQKGARNIALASEPEHSPSPKEVKRKERILIPVNDPQTVEELIALSVTIKTPNFPTQLYGLHVITNETYNRDKDKRARRLLDRAAMAAAATDDAFEPLLRYDSDVANGIISTIHEQNISDLILQLRQNPDRTETMLPDPIIRRILGQDNVTTMIYKPVQPLSTAQRYIVVVPEHAEKELGFALWMRKVWNMSRNTSTKVIFYAHGATLEQIRETHRLSPIEAEFKEFNEWDDFLILFREVQPNDILLVVMSRKGWPSYHRSMSGVPVYLGKYLQSNGFILIYPRQMGMSDYMNSEPNTPSVFLVS